MNQAALNVLNTCFEGNKDLYNVVYYSHFVPIAIALLISVYVLYKTRFSLLSIVFSAFNLGFSLWLIGDVVTWLSRSYDMVVFSWATLDYINMVFFILGAYFFAFLIRGRDISLWEKIFLFALSLPGFYITFSGNSILGFQQATCDATNNNFLTHYKLFVETCAMLYSLFYAFAYSKYKQHARNQVVVVTLALMLFFLVFSITEYLASTYGIYKVNLYGLFSLPVFLLIMLFSMSSFKLFDLKLLGSQLIAYVMVIIVATQFLFLKSSTNIALNAFTLVISIGFGYVLVKNTRRETAARLQIEKLAADLQVANAQLVELNKQKSEFVSFASHQLRSPLTSIIGNSSLILEGDAGPVSEPVKSIIKTIMEATKTQINVVESYLNSSRIELGTMKYSLIDMDFKDLTKQVMAEQKPNIEAKGLTHTLTIDESQSYKIKADPDKFKQVLMNIVDNSLKYTAKGSVNVSLVKDAAKGLITFKVSDTGVGIRADVMPKLFQKFSRAENANEANIHGTGLGLFIARDIVKAHGGRVWAESEGEGKGSQFYVEVPEAK